MSTDNKIKVEPSSYKALVLGFSAIDIIKIKSGDTVIAGDLRLGGVGTNVARVLAALGVSTTFIAHHYTGEPAIWLQKELQRYNISYKCINTPAPLAMSNIIIGQHGEDIYHDYTDFGISNRIDQVILESIDEADKSSNMFIVCTNCSKHSLLVLQKLL